MTLKLRNYVFSPAGVPASGKTTKLYELVGAYGAPETETYLGGTYADVITNGAGGFEFTGLDETKKYRAKVEDGASKAVFGPFSGQADELQILTSLKFGASAAALVLPNGLTVSGAAAFNGEVGIATINGAGATGVTLVPHNTPTPLALTTEQFDVGAMHSNVTLNTRITIGVTGAYIVAGNVTFSGAAGTYRTAYIYVNGAMVTHTQIPVSSITGVPVVAVLYLTAGDYVQLYAFQNSGIDDTSVLSRLAVVRLAGI